MGSTKYDISEQRLMLASKDRILWRALGMAVYADSVWEDWRSGFPEEVSPWESRAKEWIETHCNTGVEEYPFSKVVVGMVQALEVDDSEPDLYCGFCRAPVAKGLGLF